MRQDQYYDKAIDKLQKIETALNRTVRSLDRIATALEQEPETPLDKAMHEAREIFGGIEAMPIRPSEAVEQDAKEWENIHR